MHGASIGLRRSASWLAIAWLCAWLAPAFHYAQCGEHHDVAACAACQLATTPAVGAPAQTAPALLRTAARHFPTLGNAFVPRFQGLEHPPRGPPATDVVV
jgi:hypothetical protein